MEKAKQLALGQLLKLPDDHPIMKDLLTDPDTVALAQIAVIDKDDFFAAVDAEGKSFFDYVDTWAHMDEAITALREKGLDIKGSDFTVTVTGTKSPVALADDRDVLANLFTPVIWQGQYNAMLGAWFGLGYSNPRKDKIDFVAVQEKVAATEGKTCRVAQLRDMGIDPGDMRSAVTSGDYAKVREKLAAKGDHFRREDVFLLDKWGDHTLDSSAGWKHFVEMWDELTKNGERLEIEDFLFGVPGRDTILKDAQDDSDGLKQMFTPRLWYGRADDVIKLHGMLSNESKAKVKLDEILEELISHDYAVRVDNGQIAGRADLMEPLNAADRDKPDFHAVRPLGLKEVWDKIARVQDLLQAKGEALTLDDLRQKSGKHDDSCLLHAARYGNFDKVIAIMRAGGGELRVDELIEKDENGKSIVDHLASQDKLGLILEPRDWIGRGQDLAKLWQVIPERARDKINFQELIGTLNTAGLRRHFAARMPAP
ncbi:MAG TPA: hypothetical protein VL625_06710 [Patescibacteria group bacterium]|nr:hypothetical protein [Patescibacteria group bacterium]